MNVVVRVAVGVGEQTVVRAAIVVGDGREEGEGEDEGWRERDERQRRMGWRCG